MTDEELARQFMADEVSQKVTKTTTTLDEQPATAPLTRSEPIDDIDLARQFLQDENNAKYDAAEAMKNGMPEDAASVRALSERFETTRTGAKIDKEYLQGLAERDDIKEYLENAPAITRWINNNQLDAPIFKNDIKALSELEQKAQAILADARPFEADYDAQERTGVKYVDDRIDAYEQNPMSPVSEAVQAAWRGMQAGYIMSEQGALWDAAIRDRTQFGKPLFNRSAEIDKAIESLSGDEDYRSGFMYNAGQIVGTMGGSMVYGIEGGKWMSALYALVAGGAALLASGGTAAPIVAPTVGGYLGAVSLGSMSEGTRRIEAGLQMKDLIEAGVPYEKARDIAMGVGVLNTAIEMAGLKILGKAAKPMLDATIGKFSSKAVKALEAPTMGRLLADTAKTLAVGSGQEVLTEVLQEVANISGDEIGRIWGETGAAGITAEEVYDRLMDIAVNTFKGTVVLGGIGAGPVFIANTRRIYRAQQTQDFFKAVSDATSSMQGAQLSPGAASEVVQAVAENQGAGTVWIDGEVFKQVSTQAGVTAEDINNVIPGLGDQMEQAAQTGGDVVISTGDFATKISATPLGQELVDHVRLSESGLSKSEANMLEKAMKNTRYERLMATLKGEDEKAQAINAEGMKLKNKLYASFVSAGMDKGQARVQADFAYRVTTNLAKAANMSVEEFEKKHPNVVVDSDAVATAKRAERELATSNERVQKAQAALAAVEPARALQEEYEVAKARYDKQLKWYDDQITAAKDRKVKNQLRKEKDKYTKEQLPVLAEKKEKGKTYRKALDEYNKAVAENRNYTAIRDQARQRMGVTDAHGIEGALAKIKVQQWEKSLQDDVEAWKKAIDDMKSMPTNHVRMLKQTPLVMRLVGANFREVFATPHFFERMFNKEKDGSKSTYGVEEIKEIPEALTDPVAVFAQDNGRLLFLLDVKTESGASVLVPVEFDAQGEKAVVNLAITAYAKESHGKPNYGWLDGLVGKELYVNTKKIASLITHSGANSLRHVSERLDERNIKTEKDLVKLREQYNYRLYQHVSTAIPGAQTIQKGLADDPLFFRQWADFRKAILDKDYRAKSLIALTSLRGIRGVLKRSKLEPIVGQQIDEYMKAVDAQEEARDAKDAIKKPAKEKNLRPMAKAETDLVEAQVRIEYLTARIAELSPKYDELSKQTGAIDKEINRVKGNFEERKAQNKAVVTDLYAKAQALKEEIKETKKSLTKEALQEKRETLKELEEQLRKARKKAATYNKRQSERVSGVVANLREQRSPIGKLLTKTKNKLNAATDALEKAKTTKATLEKEVKQIPAKKRSDKGQIEQYRAAYIEYLKKQEIASGIRDNIADTFNTADETQVVNLMESVIDFMRGNLVKLYQMLGEKALERAKLWYVGGNKTARAWAQRYGLRLRQTAAIIAVFSPQNGWFNNMTNAERLLDIYFSARRVKTDSDKALMAEIKALAPAKKVSAAAFVGKSLDDLVKEGKLKEAAVWVRAYDTVHNPKAYNILTPEGGVGGIVLADSGEAQNSAFMTDGVIQKGLSLIVDGSVTNVYAQIGSDFKVRNFYNNLYDPNNVNAATIDTHAVGAALLAVVSSDGSRAVSDNFNGIGNAYGQEGTYPFYFEAYRRAAEACGVSPREMQSITWEAIRVLFLPEEKQRLRPLIDQVWKDYEDGKIELDAARDKIFEIAGGLKALPWESTPFTTEVTQTYDRSHVKLYNDIIQPEAEPMVAVEVAPNPHDQVAVDQWKALTPDEQLSITQEIVPWILQKVGAATKTFISEPYLNRGGYEGQPNDSIVCRIADNGDYIKVARLLASYLRQNSVMVVSEKAGAGMSPSKVICIQLPDNYTNKEVDALYVDCLDKIRDASGRRLIAGHSTSDHVMTISVDANDIKAIKPQLAAVEKVVKGLKWDIKDAYTGFLTPYTEEETKHATDDAGRGQGVLEETPTGYNPNLQAETDAAVKSAIERRLAARGAAGEQGAGGQTFKQRSTQAVARRERWRNKDAEEHEQLRRKLAADFEQNGAQDYRPQAYEDLADSGLDEKARRKRAASNAQARAVRTARAVGARYRFVREYDGRRVAISGVDGILGVFEPDEKLSAIYNANGIDTPKIFELTPTEKNAKFFHDGIQSTKKDIVNPDGTTTRNKHAAAVYVYSEDEYRRMRLFVTADGTAGVAVKTNGDIVSVFKTGSSELHGAAHPLMETAKVAGGNHLDCYDTVLGFFYAPHGFRCTVRQHWSDGWVDENGELHPHNKEWVKADFWEFNHGEPDVAYFSRDDSYFGGYAHTDGEIIDTYEEVQALHQEAYETINEQEAFGQQDEEVLHQDGPDDVNGSYNPATNTIHLTPNADLTTFAHEMSHWYLEQMMSVGQLENAEAWLKEDAKTMLKVFGLDSFEQWNNLDFETKEKLHEQFSHQFELYLAEGKAPTEQTRGLFRRMGKWVRDTYRRWTGGQQEAINQRYKDQFGEDLPQLSDEVKRVMDRMIAGEDAVVNAEELADLKPLFEEKPEGVTDEEWFAYQAEHDAANGEATEKLAQMQAKDERWYANASSKVLKEIQAKAKEARERVRAIVADEVNSRPEAKAFDMLKSGGKAFGLDNLKIDPKSLKGFDRNTIAKLQVLGLLREDGVHIDTAREMLRPFAKFKNNRQMVRRLIAFADRETLIDKIAERECLAKYSDLFDPQKVQETVNKALASEARERVIETELKYLSGEKNSRVMLALAKAQAREVIGRTKLRQANVRTFIDAASRASRKAMQAFKAGDRVRAAYYKRQQLVNMQAARMVVEAENNVERLKKLKELIFKNDKKLAAGYDTNIIAVARVVLANSNFKDFDPGSMTPADVYLDKVRKYDPEIEVGLQSIVDRHPYRPGADPLEMTVDEFTGLFEDVHALVKIAKDAKLTKLGNRSVAISEAVDQLKAQLEKRGLKSYRPGQNKAASKHEEHQKLFMSAIAYLRRVESWCRSMDGGEQGVFTNYIYRPIAEAAARYRTKNIELQERFVELLRPMEEKWDAVGEIEAPEINYTFARKSELIAALLHTGNESNKEKLLVGGRGEDASWADVRVDETGNEVVSYARWEAFVSRCYAEGIITKEDMNFVQSVWDLLEDTKVMSQKAFHEYYGLYFDEVPASPVITPFGVYRGGYVPAATDPILVAGRDKQLEQDLFEKSNNFLDMMPVTEPGWAKKRVKYNKPLQLNVSRLSGHIQSVVKFSMMAPTVKNVQALIRSHEFADAMNDADPQVISDLLQPWLRRAATQTVSTANNNFDRILNKLRGLAGMSLMAANVANTLQQYTGFSIAIQQTGAKWMGLGLREWYHDRKTAAEFVMELSPFMKARLDDLGFEFQNEQNRIASSREMTKREKVVDWAQRHGYFLQTAAQKMIDIPVWLAAYRKAQAEGMSDEDAVFEADSTIRRTQSSFDPENIAGVETGSPLSRSLLVFYNYFNMQLNLLGESYTNAKENGQYGTLLKDLFLIVVIPAVLSEIIAQAFQGFDTGDDDDWDVVDGIELITSSTFKNMVAMVPWGGMVANVAGTKLAKSDVPVVSPVARMLFGENPYNDKLISVPVASLIENAIAAVPSVSRTITEGKNARGAARNTLDALTLMTGVPFSGLKKPVGYLAALANDEADPENWLDVTRGLFGGKDVNK